MFRKVLVTVGTTEFSGLIGVISSGAFISAIKMLGCTELVVQYGRGVLDEQALDAIASSLSVSIRCFRFTDSMEPEIEAASMVISHGGAGSIVETLSSPKRPYLIVCIILPET
jgi:UDP-N-acetylglucosamine transferase subunit ALG13